MNKLLRYGLAILLIGFGIVLVISVTSNSNIFSASDENFTLHEESYATDAFTSVTFDFDNRRVYILESPDENIHVKYYIHEKDIHEISDLDPNLTIEISREWYYSIFTFDFFANRDLYKVHLYLPTDTTIEKLDIKSSNGSLSVDIDKTFDSIDLITSNGRIDLMNLTANDIIANSSNGEIKVENLNVLNKINLKTTNGAILLDDVTSPQIDADTSNGKITAQNITSNDVSLDSSNGTVYLSVKGEKDDYRVTLSTSNGDKIYDGLKVESGTINTAGNYLISLDSSNGDVEVDFVD